MVNVNNEKIWEERNLADQLTNLSQNVKTDNLDTTIEIKKNSIKNEWSITTKLIVIKLLAPPPLIYLIKNNITGGKYVGQTRREVKYRWNCHVKSTKDYPLHRSIRKHGVENFTFSILETSPTYESLDELERKHIKSQKSYIKDGFGGYNLTTGGSGPKYYSEETRQKIGLSGKGRVSTRRGIPLTESHRQILSNILSGENNPNYGKHHSDEVKEKIAKTKRGKILSDNHKDKIRKSSLRALENISDESWKRICDAGIKNLDMRIYTFRNKFTSVVFTGYRHELYTKYKLNKNLLRRMIKGELTHTKGWGLVSSSPPVLSH